MKVVCTEDIPQTVLRQFKDELHADFEINIDEPRVSVRSAELQSWISLLADLTWWTSAGLTAVAIKYLMAMADEAGKEHWRNRAKVFSAAAKAGGKLKNLAAAIVRLRHRLSRPTSVSVGLPVPDDYFGARLVLNGSTAEELELELALFVYYIPALGDLIRRESLEQRAASGLFLGFLPNGDMEVGWRDTETLEPETRVIRRKTAATKHRLDSKT